jgi:hypothetical protein
MLSSSILKTPGPRLPFPRTSCTQVLCRGCYRQEMGCAGGVRGSLVGAHEWEGKSVRTHVNTFGQVHVHIRHHGGTERPEPRARAWFVHVDKPGARAWSLVVVVLRALGRGGKGVWEWVEWRSRSTCLPRCGMAGETTRRSSLLEGSIYKKKVGRRGRWL